MSDTEISLKDLMSRFWQARFFMLVGILFALAIGFVFLTFTIPKYKASMIVAPADGYALGDYASSVQYDRMTVWPHYRFGDPKIKKAHQQIFIALFIPCAVVPRQRFC